MLQQNSQKELERQSFDGVVFVDGFAKGTAVVLKPLGEFIVVPCEDCQKEIKRFRLAVQTLEEELNTVLKNKIAETQKKLLETSLMLLM